jgi:hypothetical protein
MVKNAHKLFIEKQFARFWLRVEVIIKTDHEGLRCDCVDWVCDKWNLGLEDLD